MLTSLSRPAHLEIKVPLSRSIKGSVFLLLPFFFFNLLIFFKLVVSSPSVSKCLAVGTKPPGAVHSFHWSVLPSASSNMSVQPLCACTVPTHAHNHRCVFPSLFSRDCGSLCIIFFFSFPFYVHQICISERAHCLISLTSPQILHLFSRN